MTSKSAAAQQGTAYGFWLYLMSDAVLFAILFATYLVMEPNLAGGPGGSELFDLRSLSIETALLLTSTLTIAFAHAAAAAGAPGRAAVLLGVTVALGLGFVGVELSEFRSMIAEGAGPSRSGFLSAFFTLVGTHGLHVTAGSIWGLTMIAQLAVKGATAPVLSRLSRLTQFWHFLDIVWICVFSVVYLKGLI